MAAEYLLHDIYNVPVTLTVTGVNSYIPGAVDAIASGSGEWISSTYVNSGTIASPPQGHLNVPFMQQQDAFMGGIEALQQMRDAIRAEVMRELTMPSSAPSAKRQIRLRD
jgi:hypothetical protein